MRQVIPMSQSIVTQVFKRVFALYCLVAVTVTLIQMIEEFRYARENVQLELESHEKVFGPVLAKALWNLDRSQMEDVFSGMAQVPAILHIQVDKRQGREYFPYASTFEQEFSNADEMDLSYEFVISYPVAGKEKELGRAILYSDNKVVFERVQVSFLFLIMNAVIKGIALWIIFWWVAKRLLIKPLNQLVYAVGNLHFDNLAEFNPQINIKEENELKLLENSFVLTVDELARAKLAVMDFNQRLEKEVLTRTGELVKAREIAEQATRAKSEFLSLMSHEFRSPLHGIQDTLQLLDISHLDEKQRRHLTIARNSSDKMLEMVEQALAFSNLEDGKVRLQPENFNLYELFLNIVTEMRHHMSNDSVTLTTNIHELEDVEAEADNLLIRQVVISILSNAIKFTYEGGIQFSAIVDIDQKTQSPLLRVEVEDTGIGMDDDELQGLFDEHSYGSIQSAGKGLGMIVTKRLCTLLGGHIRVNSQPGIGSCFILTIPLQAVDFGHHH